MGSRRLGWEQGRGSNGSWLARCIRLCHSGLLHITVTTSIRLRRHDQDLGSVRSVAIATFLFASRIWNLTHSATSAIDKCADIASRFSLSAQGRQNRAGSLTQTHTFCHRAASAHFRNLSGLRTASAPDMETIREHFERSSLAGAIPARPKHSILTLEHNMTVAEALKVK